METIGILIDLAVFSIAGYFYYINSKQNKMLKERKDLYDMLHIKYEATKSFSEKLLSENNKLKEQVATTTKVVSKRSNKK
jgi:hypothetical protein